MRLENIKFAYEIRNYIPQIITDYTAFDTINEMLCTHLRDVRGCIAITKAGQATPDYLAITNYGEADLASYFSHYVTLNPWVQHYPRLKPALVTKSEDLLPHAHLIKTAFHNEWLRPMGQADSGIGVGLTHSEGAAAFLLLNHCHNRPEEDREEMMRVLKVVSIEIGRALDFRLLAKLQDGARSGLLAGSSNPMLLLRGDGTVVNCNQTAETMFRTRSVASVGADRKLRLADSNAQSQLAAALSIMRNARPGSQPPVIRLNGEPGGGPYMFLSEAPVDLDLGPLRPLLPKRIFAMIIDPASKSVLPGKLLRHLYGLTTAETAVALAVGGGDTFDEFAEVRGLSKLTIRNQGRSAMAKMGVSRQSELVAIVQRISHAPFAQESVA